jgi:hypothetical protein
MNIEKLLSLTPSQRIKVRLNVRRKPRGAYRQHPPRTPDELLEFLKERGVRTTSQLKKLRATDKTTPTIQEYFRAFESWTAAVQQVFHKPTILQSPPPNDPAYIVKCCTQFNLWSQRDYLEARNHLPDVIPSPRQVRRVWGGFGNLFFAARKESAVKTLEAYLSLERRLGKTPSALDCQAYNLDLTPLKRFFGTKAQLDDILSYRHRSAFRKAS